MCKEILVIAIMCLVAGLVIAEADILNPFTRRAEAEGMRIENEHIQRQNAIEIVYLEERQREELRYLRARYDSDLKRREMLAEAFAFAIHAISVGFAMGLICIMMVLFIRVARGRPSREPESRSATRRVQTFSRSREMRDHVDAIREERNKRHQKYLDNSII